MRKEPELPYEPEEEEPVAVCAYCGGDIYEGEDCAVADKGFICEDCIDDQWHKLFIWEKADFLGMAYTKIERIKRHDT